MALEDVKKQQLELVKKSLDSLLANNPSFDKVFFKEYNYLYFKTHDENIEVLVSDDKKSVSLTTFSPVVDCSIKQFVGNNNSYINSRIYLKDEDMYVFYSQGVLFDRKLLEQSGFLTFANYESKFETLYSMVCYDKYGVEYSSSSYSDNYPLNKKMSELDVMNQTNSSFHRPEFNEYMLPIHPIHMQKAMVRNMYRKKGSYSVIHANIATITSNGYENVNCALYTTHPLSPELLRGETKFATAVEYEGRYIFIVDKSFADSIEDGYKKAKEELKEKIKNNKKDYDKETYNYIIDNI